MASSAAPGTRNAEWAYMDTLRPPVYVCLRRRRLTDSGGSDDPPMQLDGRLDKAEWQHVPWSDPFLDIEGPERRPKAHPLTRFKMMHDDEHLYIGAELIETRIWGTIRTMNATLYHENDFEVFLNPDGSRHNYYELEMNCLNTIWELVLNKPYKDGHSIQNPYNLEHVRTAVYVDGITNDPLTECRKWSVEVAYQLSELVQFDRLRFRKARAGDVWRVNFSRVQYPLRTVVDDDTKQLRYEKIPDTREDNIVWAPTGVVDIHRPEKWGFVFFSDADEERQGILQLDEAMDAFLCEQIAMEQILNSIYYDQRAYKDMQGHYAGSLEELYGTPDAFPHSDLVDKFSLSPPRLRPRNKKTDVTNAPTQQRPRRRSYVAVLDDDDENDGEGGHKGVHVRQETSTGECEDYVVSVRSEQQEWNIDSEARVWKTGTPMVQLQPL